MTFLQNDPRTRQIAQQGQLALKARRGDHSAAQRLQSVFLYQLSDGQWHQGKSLVRQLGTNERVIRQIAHESGGKVLSGDKGYRLTACASIQELDHAERRLRSQARAMLRRSIQLRKARNGSAEFEAV